MQTNKSLQRIFSLIALVMSTVVYASQVAVTQAFVNPLIGPLGTDPEKARSGQTTTEYFVIIWNAVIIVSGILVFCYFIWGAIEWMTSAGESGKLQSARNRMMHAVIGLLLLVASYTIISFLGSLIFQEYFDILRPTFFAPII